MGACLAQPVRSRASGSELTLSRRIGPSLYGGWAVAMFCWGRALAQEDNPLQEVEIQAQRQTALESQALAISETPNAGPHLLHPYAIIGLGPLIAPAYDGSMNTKVSPFVYLDVRGLLNDRVFVSDLEGIGVKLLNDGAVRAGLTVNYARGRTSSDDPHLKGLPDIGGEAQVGGYLVYVFRPFAIEAKVGHRLGSTSGTQASIGASVSAAATQHFHISLSADVNWADARYQQTFFGVTAAEAAQATAKGNPLPAYTPGSGLTSVGMIAAGVYQVGDHWGLVARIGFHDLLGTSVKGSPLTQRTFQPSFAVGAMYKF
jgi:MipA family protein